MTTNFSALENKISKFLSSPEETYTVSKIEIDQLLILTHRVILDSGKNVLIIAENHREVDSIYRFLRSLMSEIDFEIYHYYSHANDIHNEMYPSDAKFHKLLSTISAFHLEKNNSTKVIITDNSSLIQKYPPVEEVKHHSISLSVGENMDSDDLSEFLVDLGYLPSIEIDEPGTFLNKGEVVDIYPINSEPIRIYFDIDNIDRIKFISVNKNQEDTSIKSIEVGFAPNFILHGKYGERIKKKIPSYNLGNKELLLRRREILSQINQQIPFQNYQYFFPCAFENSIDIFNFFDVGLIIDSSSESNEQSLDIIIETLREKNLQQSNDVIPQVEDVLFLEQIKTPHLKKIKIKQYNDIDDDLLNEHISCETIDHYFSSQADQFKTETSSSQKIDILLELIRKGFKTTLFSQNTKATKEILLLFSERHPEIIDHKDIILQNGFIDHASRRIFLSDQNIFSKKIPTQAQIQQSQNDDLFAEQIASLSVGDFVIHKTHGIGRYLGLQEMDSLGNASDYIVIEYDKEDKIYLPIYRINEIQKHASGESTTYKLANLRTKNFLLQKKKIQNSIKKLAFDLVQLQAKRALTKAYKFSEPNHAYEEFELSFPFDETPDQARAIDRVLHDMQKSLPMDHLVCGDVGFGKTEVAIRAAYKAAIDNKQVAVLVPTTILALQHFHSFSRRLKNTGAIVRVMTRFQTKKEVDQTIIDLENGKVDILIGTHKILSNKVQFSDLGLVIIDEEQRFGVNHKEKFKTLKESLDFLTLTATPIPRTMQLSLLGLKEISLIKTPPPNRQAINTYVCLEENHIIKQAIEREIQRGGQVFIVNNNVKDLDNIMQRLKSLIPLAKISMAHGQLPERELEKTILEFYKGNSQILLATTIIESGIDIPNANTMIILNADKFGLSQLHQLRGRIGRSERKAFVYFTIKSHSISDVAQKRLKSLQRFSDLGAGFSIANSDLEIRGAGNIIGGDQSGHLDQIGLELYSELLEEAINDIKGQKKNNPSQTEINTIFPAFIPADYIKNNKIRLKIYKQLSNIKEQEAIDFNRSELEDQFGNIPLELDNLLSILKLRILFSKIYVKNVSILKKQISIVFNQEEIIQRQDLISQLIKLFTSRPKSYQLTQDYKFNYYPREEIKSGNFYQVCKDIADEINPC